MRDLMRDIPPGLLFLMTVQWMLAFIALMRLVISFFPPSTKTDRERRPWLYHK